MSVVRSLSPASAARLAQFIRTSTGGMSDGDWPHLTILGDPGQLMALVSQWQEQERQERIRSINRVRTAPNRNRKP